VVPKRLAGKNRRLPASAKERLKDYHRKTTALRIYFPDADFTEIDGTKKSWQAAKQIRAVLKAKVRK
jgi:hypothetical protein